MIYFVQSVDGGPVKIGHTDNLEQRLVQLESHYGTPLAVLATMDGDRSVEAGLHERFAHLRFGRTEQFRPAVEIFAFIGKPLLVSANPDAVEAMKPATASIWLKPDAYKSASLAARFRGMKLIDYLTMVVQAAADRDIEEGHRRRTQLRQKPKD